MASRRNKLFFMAVDNVIVSGIVQEMPESGEIEDVICQNCLCDTKKVVEAEIIEFGIISDIHHLLLGCEKCGESVVVHFDLEHEYAVIE